MAIEIKQAQKIEKGLKEMNPELKIEIKGTENEVIATCKKWTIGVYRLQDIMTIAKGHTITFGRSGANFRMIIW